MSLRWRSAISFVLAMAINASPALAAAAAADWPVSTGLVVAEVVTGGDKGTDEYLELFNAGDSDVQLGGLEVVYATASGKTVTRKRTWADRLMPPGTYLLVAHEDGAHAGVADHTYGGGLSAAGGSVVVRYVDGPIVDSLSWGSAASGFVEGTPGAAPAAGASLERRPGGDAGHGRDSNDNAADTRINPAPVPQGSSPAPTPDPTQKPTPMPTPQPTPKPTPKPTSKPTAQPTPVATPDPTPGLTASPSPPPTASPTLTPSPMPTFAATPVPTVMPTPEPTAAPTPVPTVMPTIPPTAKPTASPHPSTEPSATPSPSPALPVADARTRPIGTTVHVSGTVTVQAGRILGDRTIAVQDGSGGIVIRLPASGGGATLERGSIVAVSGQLAGPYGNLELRPARWADVVVIGAGGVPEAVKLDSAGIGEDREGQLASFTGTVISIDRRSSGALSITARDDKGEGLVYAHAEIGLDRALFERGDRIRVTGIVGQRASRSGAADGHRLWPRGRADIDVLGSEPGATPPSGGDPGDSPGKGRPKRVLIKNATPGRTVTIVGVVTSKAGFIDSEGRRVTVQDKSGAILVRYPAGIKPDAIGRTIRASGEVGTWFGTVQLEADDKPRVKGRGRVRATPLRRAPTEADEWRLVSVRIGVSDVERSGETWRAEVALAGGGRLPIVGLAGSGLEPDLLEPGREAWVTGIVRRAYPTASDQRFAVAPRSRADIRLGRLVVEDAADEVLGPDGGDSAGDSPALGVDDDGAVMATLGTLSQLNDRLVRVGGRLERVSERLLTLDDGTASGSVRLTDGMDAIEPVLRVGEVLNVTGRVRRRGRTAHEVVVESAADVRRAVSVSRPSTTRVSGALAGQVQGVGAIPTVGPVTDEEGGAAAGAGIDSLPLMLFAALVGAASLCFGAVGFLHWRARRRGAVGTPAGVSHGPEAAPQMRAAAWPGSDSDGAAP